MIKKSTIVRVIMLAIVLVNLVLKAFGIDLIPIDESVIASIVEMLIEVAVIVVAFWKNNSFTPKAIKADEFLQQLRESEE
jgi:SPP1 family holin